MNYWTKVVSFPLGFAAFALFLVFGLLKGRGRKPAWLLRSAIALAFIAVAGGLILQFASFSGAGKREEGNQETVRQETHGDQSPTVNSHGDVIVTYGQKSDNGAKAGGR